VDRKEILNMNEIMETLDEMNFNQTDPTFYGIIKELSEREKFSYIIQISGKLLSLFLEIP